MSLETCFRWRSGLGRGRCCRADPGVTGSNPVRAKKICVNLCKFVCSNRSRTSIEGRGISKSEKITQNYTFTTLFWNGFDFAFWINTEENRPGPIMGFPIDKPGIRNNELLLLL